MIYLLAKAAEQSPVFNNHMMSEVEDEQNRVNTDERQNSAGKDVH